MSTGKRLAKRSIIGTRIAAPGKDGKLYPGIIQAMKTCDDDRLAGGANRYTIRFEDSSLVQEFKETDIVGPGFQNVTSSKLRVGQKAYVTHCNREMEATVVHHRPNIDQVIMQLYSGGPEIKKKLEDIRILESRKSARLVGHSNTDFSKLADFNIVHERKRLNSETSDISATSRKRRGSETLSESSCDEGSSFFYSSGSCSESSGRHTPVMSECTAAMVLMNLSYTSPRSKQTAFPITQGGTRNGIASPGEISPSGSSVVSSLGSSWTSSSVQPNLTEAEALLQLSNQESDEGIVSDQSSSTDTDERIKTEHVRIIYQCTWPGCHTYKDRCSDIETHVRKIHLGKKEPESEEDNDHEEEFYFTEIEVPMTSSGPTTPPKLPRHSPLPLSSQIYSTIGQNGILTPQQPILTDHMDMARPPHENPEYFRVSSSAATTSVVINTTPQQHMAIPIAIPVSANFNFSAAHNTSNHTSSSHHQANKYIRLSPKPFGSTPKSPIRRPRGDAKKCRKVYGMDHRELWCTQCKWKKACSRFGEVH